MDRWQKIMDQSNSAPPDDVPVVLAREGQHGPVIHATNRAARLAGAQEGVRVVDAKAACPGLRVEYGDLAGDRALLDRLVHWVRRWCPWSVRDGETGLILDTTGSAHLWGGEVLMLIDMETRLSLLGLSARLACAPTWGAAWALARFGPVRSLCGDDVAAALAPLPVAGLRLRPDTLVLLRRLGLKTIGALAEAPRLSLTRRFAREPLESNPQMRLDQARGRLPEPVGSVEAAAPLIARATLPEPVQDPTDWLPALAEDLCAQLMQQGLGARRLHLAVYRTDGTVAGIAAATSAPTRDPAHLVRLFAERVAQIDPGFGFDLITLSAGITEAVRAIQVHLDGQKDDDLGLPLLIDRLAAKFGARAVKRPVLCASHMPERAEVAQTALADAPAHAAAAVARDRPLRLLAVPEQVTVIYAVPEGPPARFVWRRQTHLVARYEGPERIAPEWWHDRPGTRLRDYFKIEDQRGRRLWVYREGLHGDGRGGAPCWFVHGMFG